MTDTATAPTRVEPVEMASFPHHFRDGESYRIEVYRKVPDFLPYGWISPDGKLYAVETCEHSTAAEYIAGKLREDGVTLPGGQALADNGFDALLQLGWLHIDDSGDCYTRDYYNRKDAQWTQKQIDFCFDAAMKFGRPNYDTFSTEAYFSDRLMAEIRRIQGRD